MNENLLLDARSIVMSFGGLRALNEVDVCVRENEILGLIGPNGSGKTTFFNIVTGIYRPTSGSLRFRSEEIGGLSPQEIAGRGILRTFQSSRLWLELSIVDTLLLGMWMQRKTPFLKSIFLPRRLQAEYSEKIDQALEILTIFNPELSAGRYRQVKELPLVDRRRVEICRALLADPVLLLLDEPAAGMDPSETRELMTDIRKMKERVSSLSVIVIEHDMDVISDIAERVVVFNFGKKISEGPFSEIRRNAEVREAYLGKGYADA